MTEISTIEDVLESILGLVLGGAPGQYELATSGDGGGQSSDKSSINDAYRPRTILGPGFWMITQISTLNHNGSWAPEYNKDAVTFYRWKQDGVTKKITRLTVWVGMANRRPDGSDGDQTPATPSDSNNPVVKLGSAWEQIHNEIPRVAGVGTTFDPNAIEAVREIFGTLTSHAMDIAGELKDEMAKVNVKNPDFKGSAELAWYHRVQGANRWVSDLQTQFARWDGALYQAEEAAKSFIKALADANYAWSQITPAGTWQNPYRVIAAMFNQGILDYSDRPGQSDSWDLGTQYANTGDVPKSEHYTKDGTVTTGHEVGTVYWTPPSWLNYHRFDAFSIDEWNNLDHHIRQMWANNVITVFKDVLPAALNLVQALAAARNPMSLTDPEPVPPLPMPNNVGMPNGGNTFPNWDKAFPNWDKAFPNWDNAFPNWDNAFPNWDNAFPNWDNAFPNGGGAYGGGGNNPYANSGSDNPFANTPVGNGFLTTSFANPYANSGSDNPFADTPLGLTTSFANPYANSGSDNPFANNGADNPFSNGLDNGGLFTRSVNPFADLTPTSGSQLYNKLAEPQTLGDLTPTQLQQLDSAGLLDSVPLTPAEAAYLKQHGLPVADGTTTLGQLTPEQLNALQQGGLLDQTPLTDAQRAALGLTTPSSLGDLTPAQLQQLDSAGLLNSVPLTPAEAAYLKQHGLPVADGTTTLGQLTPEQLNALQQGGLLDQTPLTSAERANLGLTNPAQYGGTTYVPGLTDPSKLPVYEFGQTPPVVTNPFPTTVNGVDVSHVPSKTTTNPPLGDVTQPGAATYPNVPGVQVGTGGLSSVPGISGSPGALSQSALGVPITGSGGAGSGTGAGSGFNVSGLQTSTGETPFGGMPYMPGMMGAGGHSQKDRDRQRNTWLKEDEKVWGTDPECAPAVLGRRGRKTRAEDDEYDAPFDERPGTQDERRPYRGR